MTCNFPNCSVKGESERFVSCWLCDGLAHLKCAGLTGRILDSILDSKGLRWSCLKCRPTEIELFKVFKQARNGFKEIGRELETLTEKFRHYETLFQSFQCLNTRDENPKPKRKRPSDEDTTVSSLKRMPPPAIDLINLASPCPQGEKVPSAQDTEKTVTEYGKRKTSQDPPPNTSKSANKNLVVIPRKKAIFISRLAADTTVEDIKSYISSKLKTVDTDIRKFNFKYNRDISSFKIDVSADNFQLILDNSFWPSGVFVREFEHKRDKPPVVITKMPRNPVDTKN
uniref:Uncharacterized protein n=1 Tax=Bactrocera tryoni TaxID=59916 RepID=A0A142LX40_BACRY|nr:hypothetical protein [Bactrocera tryoni]